MISPWGRAAGQWAGVSPRAVHSEECSTRASARGQEAEAIVPEQTGESFLLRGRGETETSVQPWLTAGPEAPAHWAPRDGVVTLSSCGQHPER